MARTWCTKSSVPRARCWACELEPPSVRRCANRCEFCFIEGLPKGLRKPLYVRDDDYRLSFAYGNFATLSNLKDRDIARILEYRLSPLYVSVHATPWDARKVLLNNPRVPNVVEQLTRLAAGGIQFHTQMVIVPGLNDGDVLEQSLADLWALGDAVMSVAVVPGGAHAVLAPVHGKSMDAAAAAGLLDHLARWAARARGRAGRSMGVRVGRVVPAGGRVRCRTPTHYGDFVQIENGVGAVAALRQRVPDGLASLPRLDGAAHRRGDRRLDARISCRRCSTSSRRGRERAFELIVAENSLFGPTTTTAGLLVGADIRRALQGARGSRPGADSRRDDQRRRPVPGRPTVHRRTRGTAHSRLSVIRLHRRAGARRRPTRSRGAHVA